MTPFSIEQGLLDETSAIRLFAAAQLSQITGTFSFQRENVSKWVVFSKGKVVGARSSQISESLGRLLTAWGWISHEAYVASLDRMNEGKEKHGQILASMGVFDQNRIPEALRRQNLVRIADTIAWDGGRYSFAPGDALDREDFPLWRVFREGLFKRYGREGLEKRAAELRLAVPKRCDGLFEAFIAQTQEALALYDRIDGKRALSELGRSEANQHAFFCGILVLAELGLIEMTQAPAEDPLEKAFRRARQLAPSDLLQVDAKATPDEVHAAVGKVLARFTAGKYMQSRFYQPLISLVEEAGRKLIHTVPSGVKPSQEISLQAEQAFQQGHDFLNKRQLTFAIHKFEEAVFFAPSATELKGYLAWARFLEAPKEETRLRAGVVALEEAVAADPQDPELHAFHGALLRLVGKLVEAEAALQRALELDPASALAKRELDSVNMRLGRQGEKDAVNLNAIDTGARIVLQRWIGGNGIVANFPSDEMRIGSGAKDDLAVSNAVLPQIMPSHCTVFRQNESFLVRRNGSTGVVLINGRLLQPREEVAVTAADRITLGVPQNGPVLEFRVLDLAFLAKLRQGIKRQDKDLTDVWIG